MNATSEVGEARLVLVRHAKTEQSDELSDHERQLLPRGVADARAAGVWLLDEAGLMPDLVLCSSATRARQTWEHMAEHDDLADVEVQTDDRIYNAHPDELLDVINEVPDGVRTVVLIGHSPGVPDLAELLSDPDTSEDEAFDQIGDHLPTMGCMVLAHDLAWSDLGRSDCAALTVGVPRRAGHEAH